MGGEYFYMAQKAASARDAFDILVAAAQYEHGHGGYTGTIAEKSNLLMVAELPDGKGPEEHAESVNEGMPYDKWGPARCFQISPGRWAFFGDASA